MALLKPGWRDPWTARWLLLLKICTSATLAARGWLTWNWDSPVRGLIWKEDWWTGVLASYFSIPWETFARQSDPYITTFLTIIGIGMMLLAVVPWLVERLPRLRPLLWVGLALLVLDSFARWVGKNYDFGMAIEHSLQMLSPIALLLALSFPDRIRSWCVAVLIATAFTFAGHGFYAAGLHPVPLSYQTMTMALLGTGKEATLLFLSIAGWLDIAAALALLFAPLRSYALYYCIGWGFLTALARVAAHVGPSVPGWGLDPWVAEMLVRTSHWLLPFLLLGLLRRGFRLP